MTSTALLSPHSYLNSSSGSPTNSANGHKSVNMNRSPANGFQQRAPNGFGSNVSRLKSVFFEQGGGEPPPPSSPNLGAYSNTNRSRSLSTPRSDSSPKLVTTSVAPTQSSSLSAGSGSIVLNRIHLINSSGHNPGNISCSTSSLITRTAQSPPSKLSPPTDDDPETMLISSDHLTRFQSAKALFARMEEESARQQRRTAAKQDTQPPHSNIFLIKSKFETPRDHSVGAVSSSNSSRRSLAFGVGGTATPQFAPPTNKLTQLNPRKRLTMGPISTETQNIIDKKVDK